MKGLLHLSTLATEPEDTLVHCEARVRTCLISFLPNIVKLEDNEVDGGGLKEWAVCRLCNVRYLL